VGSSGMEISTGAEGVGSSGMAISAGAEGVGSSGMEEISTSAEGEEDDSVFPPEVARTPTTAAKANKPIIGSRPVSNPLVICNRCNRKRSSHNVRRTTKIVGRCTSYYNKFKVAIVRTYVTDIGERDRGKADIGDRGEARSDCLGNLGSGRS
jgi:hypothetical protein